MPQKVGSWFSFETPKWEIKLETCPDEVIEETGLTKDELKRILTILSDHHILDED